MDEQYTCDECGRRFPLTQVQITNGGERTICASCQPIEERVFE
jgi:predicted nucleic acid-binding Zn ribbon protein